MCVVGEWGGDTGSSAFTAALLAGWRLVQRVALPNWPDSAHELTVWERPDSPPGKCAHGLARRPPCTHDTVVLCDYDATYQQVDGWERPGIPANVSESRMGAGRCAWGLECSQRVEDMYEGARAMYLPARGELPFLVVAGPVLSGDHSIEEIRFLGRLLKRTSIPVHRAPACGASEAARGPRSSDSPHRTSCMHAGCVLPCQGVMRQLPQRHHVDHVAAVPPQSATAGRPCQAVFRRRACLWWRAKGAAPRGRCAAAATAAPLRTVGQAAARRTGANTQRGMHCGCCASPAACRSEAPATLSRLCCDGAAGATATLQHLQ